MNRKILLIEDNEQNSYLATFLLERHGYQVVSAPDGPSGIEMAQICNPALILLDIQLPVMDGYTLLRNWKADATFSDIPFVVYTATYTDDEDERLALDCGADAFILKPCEPEDFLSRLRDVVAAASARPPCPPREPAADEKILLQSYSETLVRKLEARTEQLEKANRALQQDIDARNAAEASLRESERNNREKAALLDQTQDAILVTDLDGRILYWNQAAIHIYGWRWTKPSAARPGNSSTAKSRHPMKSCARCWKMERGGANSGTRRKTAPRWMSTVAGHCCAMTTASQCTFWPSTPTSPAARNTRQGSCARSGWRASGCWPGEWRTTSTTCSRRSSWASISSSKACGAKTRRSSSKRSRPAPGAARIW